MIKLEEKATVLESKSQGQSVSTAQHGLSAKLGSLEKHVFQSAAKRQAAHP